MNEWLHTAAVFQQWLLFSLIKLRFGRRAATTFIRSHHLQQEEEEDDTHRRRGCLAHTVHSNNIQFLNFPKTNSLCIHWDILLISEPAAFKFTILSIVHNLC